MILINCSCGFESCINVIPLDCHQTSRRQCYNCSPWSLGRDMMLWQYWALQQEAKTKTGITTINNEEETDVETSATQTYQNIFYVHRNILSSVRFIFKSQFSAEVRRNSTAKNFGKHYPSSSKCYCQLPVLLDYLRQLAMYFGVDMLLEEITHTIIHEDTIWKTKRHVNIIIIAHPSFWTTCYSKLWYWLKTLQGAIELAAAIHTTLIGEYEFFLSNNDTAVMLAWKRIMSNLDMGFDVCFFFASINTNTLIYIQSPKP